MSDSGAVGTDGGTTPLAAAFDLSAADVGLLEDYCCRLLGEVGIDGRQLFQRLQAGDTMGSALGLTPEVNELLYARAYRWFAVGRPDRAEPVFRALCISDGKVADYWVGLGVCLRVRDDLDGAALALTTAARVRPGWAVPAFHMCELLLRKGDLAGAAEQLKRFEERTDAEIPAAMTAEMDRMRRAIRVRQSGGS